MLKRQALRLSSQRRLAPVDVHDEKEMTRKAKSYSTTIWRKDAYIVLKEGGR
jgi:hypothetical protein